MAHTQRGILSPVRLSAWLLHSGIVSKRLITSSKFTHCLTASSFWFSQRPYKVILNDRR